LFLSAKKSQSMSMNRGQTLDRTPLTAIPEGQSKTKRPSSARTTSLTAVPEGRTKTKRPSTARHSTKSRKTLYALFDTKTFALDSAVLSTGEAVERRTASPEIIVSSRAVQEYTNSATRMRLSVIVFSAHDMKRMATARVPCLGGDEEIYIQKVKVRESGQTWMDISQQPPKHENKVRVIRRMGETRRHNRVRWVPAGMAIVVVWTMTRQRRSIETIYFHGHGGPVFTPKGLSVRSRAPAAKRCVMPLWRSDANAFVADRENVVKRHSHRLPKSV